jgi:hypothetical protein
LYVSYFFNNTSEINKMPIYKIDLKGVHTFWIEWETENIKDKIEDFEYERGKFGFPRLTTPGKLATVKMFLAACPGAKIKYHTILEKQLKFCERTVTWLDRRLEENGFKSPAGTPYTYSTIMRWLRAEAQPRQNVYDFMKELLQVD